jgi:hypothetical protein
MTTCPRCNGTRLVLVRVYDRRSLAGYDQKAAPCPLCCPRPAVEPDHKMAAAGDAA